MVADALQTQSPNLGISLIEDTRSTIQRSSRMDYDIQTDAERVIREDEVLCGMTDQVDVLVSAGIVYLSGYVATIAHKARAESDVSRVEGVEGVENHLYSDEELRVLVADEISRDADLSRHLLEVRSTKGFIRLDGHVASDNLAKTAVRLLGTVVPSIILQRLPTASFHEYFERALLTQNRNVPTGAKVEMSPGVWDHWVEMVNRIVT